MSLSALLSLGTAHSWNVSLVLLLLKATLILIAALGITFAMQRASAGARHLVWLVTLGALALIPALTAWAPLRLEILPATTSSLAPLSPLARSTGHVPATQPTTITAANGATVSISAAPSSSYPETSPTANVAPRTVADRSILDAIRGASVWMIILGVWIVVALAILVMLAWSALVVRRLVRRSQPLADESWVTPLYEVSDRLGLPEPPRLLLSHDAKMPFACGIITPTIVLPAECATWSHDRRLAVLLHELAHVRRHDMLGHTLGRLVCAVYWFHPLVWTAARQLRSESERACDDMALACGTRAADYAEHLLEIVTSVRREGTPMVALAMARRKEFEGRMLAILDPELRHSTPSRRQSATLIATLAVISIVVGAAAPAPKSARAAAVASSRDERSPAAQSGVAQSTAIVSATSEHAARDTSRGASIAQRTNDAPSSAAAEHLVESQLERRLEKYTEMRLDSQKQLSMRVVESPAASHAPADPSPVSVKTNASGVSVNVDVANLTRSAISAVLDEAKKGLPAKHGALGAADDRPLLLAKVLRTDTSAALRRVAAWGLHEYAEQNVAAEALGAALRRDANEEVREMSAWSLAQGNDLSVAVEPLRAALHSDASVAVRRTAAWALGMVGDQGAVSTLVGALSDADATVRSRSAWALGNIEPHQAPKPLIAMLADKDRGARENAAWALFQIEDPDAAPALQAALRTETDKDLQVAYIRALASLGEKSVDALRPLLESSDPRIKSMAVHALAGGRATGPWPRPMPQPRPWP